MAITGIVLVGRVRETISVLVLCSRACCSVRVVLPGETRLVLGSFFLTREVFESGLGSISMQELP